MLLVLLKTVKNSSYLVLLFWNIVGTEKAYDQEILVPGIMHFCTGAPATAAKTYYEYTLDRNATSAHLIQRR